MTEADRSRKPIIAIKKEEALLDLLKLSLTRQMHSDSKKRCASFLVTALFAAGDLQR